MSGDEKKDKKVEEVHTAELEEQMEEGFLDAIMRGIKSVPIEDSKES